MQQGIRSRDLHDLCVAGLSCGGVMWGHSAGRAGHVRSWLAHLPCASGVNAAAQCAAATSRVSAKATLQPRQDTQPVRLAHKGPGAR
jgi:hypothetical protein